MTLWHGWHLSEVTNHTETCRLGAVCPEPVQSCGDPPSEYVASGVYHRPARFWTFAEAQAYLDGRGNRRSVGGEVWAAELYG